MLSTGASAEALRSALRRLRGGSVDGTPRREQYTDWLDFILFDEERYTYNNSDNACAVGVGLNLARGI